MDTQVRSIFGFCGPFGWHMERDRDHAPECTRTGLRSACVYGVQLDCFAPGRNHVALAFRQDMLLAVVTDDAQRDHRRLGGTGGRLDGAIRAKLLVGTGYDQSSRSFL